MVRYPGCGRWRVQIGARALRLQPCAARLPPAGYLVSSVTVDIYCPYYDPCGPYELSLRTVNPADHKPTAQLLTDTKGLDAAKVMTAEIGIASLTTFTFANPVPVDKNTLVAVYVKPAGVVGNFAGGWTRHDNPGDDTPFPNSGWFTCDRRCGGSGPAHLLLLRMGLARAQQSRSKHFGATCPLCAAVWRVAKRSVETRGRPTAQGKPWSSTAKREHQGWSGSSASAALPCKCKRPRSAVAALGAPSSPLNGPSTSTCPQAEHAARAGQHRRLAAGDGPPGHRAPRGHRRPLRPHLLHGRQGHPPAGGAWREKCWRGGCKQAGSAFLHSPALTSACPAPSLPSQVAIYAGNPNPARAGTATQAVLEVRCRAAAQR